MSTLRPESGSRDERLGEAVFACVQALEAGQPLGEDEVRARYPDLADDLLHYLDGRRAVEQVAAPLRHAVQAGLPDGTPGNGAAGPGSVLGDFRILREVGRGGMGVVYEAEQISLKRRVALKVLPLAATMDPRGLQRFQNEARAAACLHHTHIVPVHAVGCERGIPFYAMQFIDGRSLADMLRELRKLGDGRPEQQTTVLEPPPGGAGGAVATKPEARQTTATGSGAKPGREYFRRVAEWGVQAAEALDHAHQLGVVHRDVKPANLLVDGRGSLWVTDFGLAQIQQGEASLTRTGDLVGTLRYMSPEQALAKRVVVDHRTDVYSLGATLYELLTLRPAFGGNDRHELLRQIAFDEPKPPRKVGRAVPPELEVIVLKALEKNPAERYATAQEVADDLRRWLDDRPIQARRPSFLQRARKWARRHQPAVRAGAALLVLAAVLCGGVGVWWLQKRAGAQADARAALGEAVRYQQQERWSEGLSAAKRAQGVLADLWADPALCRQADDLARDLEMAQRLEEAGLQATASGDGGFDGKATDEAHGQAFQWYGLDVEHLDPREAGERIRSRSIRPQLAMAMDRWAMTRLRLKVEGWERFMAISRVADPDAWRNRLRDAMQGKDPRAVEELSASDPREPLPLPTAQLFSTLANGTPTAERDAIFLRQAQRRHPEDFWLN